MAISARFRLVPSSDRSAFRAPLASYTTTASGLKDFSRAVLRVAVAIFWAVSKVSSVTRLLRWLLVQDAQVQRVAVSLTASQVATALRSSRVISVMLLGGMAWVSTLWMRMISAWRAISSGVSRRKPFGAVVMPSQTGSAAWHMEQRDWIVSTASSNDAVTAEGVPSAGAVARLAFPGLPRIESQIASATEAAATPQVHQGDPLPACCELKKWRITAPAMTISPMMATA